MIRATRDRGPRTMLTRLAGPLVHNDRSIEGVFVKRVVGILLQRNDGAAAIALRRR